MLPATADISDTIVAIATPPGVGGVGIVRLSGVQSGVIGGIVTGNVLRPRVAALRSFTAADGTQIDQGIALFFRGPHSFTGEDVLELQGHGGPVVMDLLLSRCLELGARPARPGEFAQRAFLNGKLDLAQAEAIADLIESTTALAAKLAVRSLQGVFSGRVRALVDDLIRLRSFVEATLDFPEEEIDSTVRIDLKADVCALIDSANLMLIEAHQGERIRDGLTVVIAGRPNSGKSSLLNALVKCDAAIVMPLPGTTRDVLRCDIQIDGLPVRIMDTAGIRETQDPVEQEGVRRARDQIAQADQLLWVYDGSVGLDPDELTALPAGVGVTLVRNKIDLPTDVVCVVHSDRIPEVHISALTGEGIEALRRHLRSVAGVDGLGEGSFVARRRHLDALRRGLKGLRAANDAIAAGIGPEVIALELTEAQHAFGEITGDFTSDDLLGSIFSTFCIGK